MPVYRSVVVALVVAGLGASQTSVSFPDQDGRLIHHADKYGEGERGVVLAHGGQFNKESWTEKAQALGVGGFVC